MKKIYSIISAVVLTVTVLSAQSDARFNVSTAEQAPSFGTGNSTPTPQTPWQVLFQHDITSVGAGVGHAACVLHGVELWTAKWANDTIRTFSLTGTLLQAFTIPGVTGVRSFTTDGTHIYAGANTANIYKIDPVGHTLVQTISVPSVPNVRYCTYDATANNNQGGFWVGTWTTDFTQVSMTGAQTGFLVAASSHLLTATYGLAYDGTSPGGPYVWAFHQTAANQAADIIQVKISTEMQTAVMHNVLNDMGTATDLAGGLHVRSTPLSLLGTLQGAANIIFAYDIAGVSSTPENPNQTDFIGVYPNPTSSMVNVQVNRTNNEQMQIELIDVVGNIIYTSPNVGINNYFDMSQYQAGIYFVKVTYNGQVFTQKIVRN